MSEIKVALRYSKALLELAKSENLVEEVNNDMKLFYQTVKASSQLRAVLSNPIVSTESKRAILHQLFDGKVNKITIGFFDIMVSKGREAFIYEGAKQYFELYNELNGIVKAEVVSAVEMTEASKKELINTIEKALSRKVLLQSKVNPKLIGGFILTVGDKQYDTSISSGLNDLRRNFLSDEFVSQLSK
ncbi:ATP synthase F1 subunit delta [Solitalea koreensis]|uniref:ATP synthase subunit delta n=1 Tax=Solitalea koreensis TaxID=543615 RepID=A0A521ATP8_9SPHI|nr:ATP synthase F1 subunit delta [Solitalea koreensis]SMO38184.1 ATP synthase F1 subcomplex delta subunit [Solitalea koreensis]